MQDICIIGGGAAGISMAISAAREDPAAKILLIEKNNQIGRKILASGNGKCNIGNRKGPELARTLTFFQSLGLLIREEEEGRLYPYCEQSSSVTEAFEVELRKLHVDILLQAEVEKIEILEEGFLLHIKDKGSMHAKRIGIATGGKAAPQFGTTGDGFRFARSLGHSVSKLAPVLMPVNCQGEFLHLKGIRAKGQATLWKNGLPLGMETGEVQFTEEGLSGICIFNLSRLIKLEGGVDMAKGFQEYSISLDLMPEISTSQMLTFLKDKQKVVPDEKGPLLLHSVLHERLAEVVFRRALDHGAENVGQLKDTELEKLAETMKFLSFVVTGGKGWKFAQCTSGGVELKEINMETMESNLVKGVFFGGEVMDFDGPCGGFNLQHAWLSGIRAGHNIVKE